jgi:hypothetical protein
MALLVAVVGLGVAQIQAKKPPKPPACPTPAPGCFCTTEYMPVICSEGKKNSPDCEYSNMCFALCAGWSVEQCAFLMPYPPPVPM